MCGDAHVLNFGLWATPERQLSFDLRDFDETLPGPFEWDVARRVASVAVLARVSGVKSGGPRRPWPAACGLTGSGWPDIGAGKLDIWYDLITVDQLIAVFTPADQELAWSFVEKKAQRRTNPGAVKKFTEPSTGGYVSSRRHPSGFVLRTPRRDRRARSSGPTGVAARGAAVSARPFLVVDVLRQVVGVGSVGMRVYLVLLRVATVKTRVPADQAGRPVGVRGVLRRSRYPNHGQRVVVGKRFIQSATDIFVGWTSFAGVDFYVRQFRDMKIIPDSELIAPGLVVPRKCGEVLARPTPAPGIRRPSARTSGRAGGSTGARRFRRRAADQTERDHRQLAAAVADGTITSAPGW